MENEIRQFWQTHPCGGDLVGDLTGPSRQEYLDFFERYDSYRYAKEPHIIANLAQIDWRGKRVLEIGLGQGADAEQIVRRRGLYSGIDLTEESVRRTQMRFALKDLPFERIEQASAFALPFDGDTFDLVFSHGVLHHIHDVRNAQTEIARVLKPAGELIAMLYAKRSLNYLISICLARRLGLAALYILRIKAGGIYGQHIQNARKMGLRRYLAMKNFINVSTDGPFNPYSKVYDRREIEIDFPSFYIVDMHKEFMHAPPLPVGRLPLASLLGWHLWVRLRPKN